MRYRPEYRREGAQRLSLPLWQDAGRTVLHDRPVRHDGARNVGLVDAANGLEVRRELYRNNDLVAIPMGNTGARSGGWFKKLLESGRGEVLEFPNEVLPGLARLTDAALEEEVANDADFRDVYRQYKGFREPFKPRPAYPKTLTAGSRAHIPRDQRTTPGSSVQSLSPTM